MYTYIYIYIYIGRINNIQIHRSVLAFSSAGAAGDESTWFDLRSGLSIYLPRRVL